jgi:hypothetical protein
MNDDKLDSFAKTLQQKTDDGRREWWKIEDYDMNHFALGLELGVGWHKNNRKGRGGRGEKSAT